MSNTGLRDIVNRIGHLGDLLVCVFTESVRVVTFYDVLSAACTLSGSLKTFLMGYGDFGFTYTLAAQ